MLFLFIVSIYTYYESGNVEVNSLTTDVSKIGKIDFLETSWAYFYVHIAIIIFPLILSFDKRVAYWRLWGVVLLAATIVAIPYLFLDHLFTSWGVWGFNETYIQERLKVGTLPLEELLFFITTPFSCLFIYVCIKEYFSFQKIDKTILKAGVAIFSLSFIVLFYVYASNIYIGLYSLLSIAALLIAYLVSKKDIVYMIVSYMISIIPFVIINGALTGSFTKSPVVLYNDAEHIGIRLGSIPATDLVYAFSHLFFCFILFDVLKRWFIVGNKA